MRIDSNNNKYNIPIKEKKKKRKKVGSETLNSHANAKRKGFSRNAVAQQTVHFRPTSKQKEFLDLQEDKSKAIREALDLLIKKRTDVDSLLDYFSLNYPLNWRRINRINGVQIKYKIKEFKNVENS